MTGAELLELLAEATEHGRAVAEIKLDGWRVIAAEGYSIRGVYLEAEVTLHGTLGRQMTPSEARDLANALTAAASIAGSR